MSSRGGGGEERETYQVTVPPGYGGARKLPGVTQGRTSGVESLSG